MKYGKVTHAARNIKGLNTSDQQELQKEKEWNGARLRMRTRGTRREQAEQAEQAKQAKQAGQALQDNDTDPEARHGAGQLAGLTARSSVRATSESAASTGTRG